MREPFCVGLTGGIGSGKSSAAEMFGQLGAAVVDTDDIAQELTRSGGAALGEIAAEFGPEYIQQDGALDRAKMRRLVFAEPAARERLERILHPRIRQEVEARIASARAPYIIVVVPLLLETGAYRALVKRVLVVDCDEALQIARATRRSGLTGEEVRAVMSAQLSRAARLAAADDVLSNDSDMDALRRGAQGLHAKYLTLAAQHSQQRE